MEKKILGRTGLEVSVAGLGCGGFSRLGMFSQGIDHAAELLRKAYDSGVNFFDTAYSYGTQPALGKAFLGVPRTSYVISSKFPYRSKEGIRPAQDLERLLDESLMDMKTDYIDVYHLHGVTPKDYETARDRFYPELLRMKEKGKIRFAAITELFGSDNSHEMLKVGLKDDLWDVVMFGYNLLNPSAAKTLIPLTLEKKVGTLCMFAVRSALSDPSKLRPDIERMIAEHQVDEKLVKPEHTIDFLTENGCAASVMEAAYRFCRHKAGIDVTLTGTASIGHLMDNLHSLSLPALPREVLDRLEAMFGNVDCVSGQQEFPKM